MPDCKSEVVDCLPATLASGNPASTDAGHRLLYMLGRPRAVLIESETHSGVLVPSPGRSTAAKWFAQTPDIISHAKYHNWLEPSALPSMSAWSGPAGKSFTAFVLSSVGRRTLVTLLKSRPQKPALRHGDETPEPKRATLSPPAMTTQQRLSQNQSPLVQQLRNRRDRGRKPLLTDAEVQAGKRLAEEFIRGAMQPRVTANWDTGAVVDRQKRAAPGAAQNLSDGASRSQDNVRRALDAVGPGLQGVLVDVCCFELGLEVIESNHCWARGTARTVLQIALTQLAEHYGLQPRDARRDRPDRDPNPMRHWADGDYRPDARKWYTGQQAEPGSRGEGDRASDS
jgi:hypothetical protein